MSNGFATFKVVNYYSQHWRQVGTVSRVNGPWTILNLPDGQVPFLAQEIRRVEK